MAENLVSSRQPTDSTPDSSIWDRITAFSSFAMAVMGIGALIFTWLQIREMRNEVTVEHLTELIDKYDSPDQITIRKSLAAKRVDQEHGQLRPLNVNDAPTELYDELGFCEDIGLLTKRGYLDPHDVWNEFGGWLLLLYTDAHPLLDSEQKQDPSEYRDCTSMVENLKSIDNNEASSANDHPSDSDLYNSYLGDIQRQSGQPAYRGRMHKKQ